MRYKVNVIATEYALNLKVPAYHMGTIIDEICARKGWERPWFVSESSERIALATPWQARQNDSLLSFRPLVGLPPLRPPRACNNPKESSEMQTRNKSFLLRLTEQEYATLKRKSELAGLKMNPSCFTYQRPRDSPPHTGQLQGAGKAGGGGRQQPEPVSAHSQLQRQGGGCLSAGSAADHDSNLAAYEGAVIMATTKILPVRKRLKDCLDYAANRKRPRSFAGMRSTG